MARRTGIIIAAAIAVTLVASPKAGAQESPDSSKAIAVNDGWVRIGGISSRRLAGAKLRLWRSIQEIVLAKDRSDRFKHPHLYGLWHDVETSGHVIYIELLDVESLSRAGQFRIEVIDPDGLQHIAVIRLNLATIDRACGGLSSRRAGGWIPLSGLGTKERYAEVLGHELAHALRAFQDPQYLRLYLELENEASQLAYGPKGLKIDADVLARLDRIARLSKQIEEPADAREAEIWHELSAQRGSPP